MRLPRTTGALSGLLIVLLGIWCGLIPFVGPYFHYAFTSYQTWHYTSDRLWLDILPGAAAVIGGLLLVKSAHRVSGTLGGWVALTAGAWLLVGPALSVVWEKSGNAAAPIGQPTGGSGRQAIELIGYFYGLGALIIALSAFAIGRFVSRPRIAEEPFVAAGAATAEIREHRRGGLFRRRRAAREADAGPSGQA